MKKLLLILTILLPMIVSAQKTIDNPVFATKSLGSTRLGIEKVVLKKDTTKLFMYYTHPGGFNMNRESRLVANGKELHVISSEGISLSGPYLDGEPGTKTHFVLNFPAVGNDVDRFDFIEDYCPQCFQIFEIALTDKAAEDIKAKRPAGIPEDIKQLSTNLKDDGKGLEKETFSFEPAIIKGRLYGFDPRSFSGFLDNVDVTVYVNDPFKYDQESFTVKLKADKSFEISVPMVVKHEEVFLRIQPFFNQCILVTGGETVVVDFDLNDVATKGSNLSPYFSGANADINYALCQPFVQDFSQSMCYSESAMKKISEFTSLNQLKKYIIDYYNDACKTVDTMKITTRAKEAVKLHLKSSSGLFLTMGPRYIPNFYARVNHTNEVPEEKWMTVDEDYLNYVKELDLDNVMMFYTNSFDGNLYGWNSKCNQFFHYYHWYDTFGDFYANMWESFAANEKLSKKEKTLALSLANLERNRDTIIPPAESSFSKKYREKYDKYCEDEKQRLAEREKAYLKEVFSNSEGYFLDFAKLQEICRGYSRGIVVPDSLVKEVEQMRVPFYAQYVKTKNAALNAKIEAEKQRGGYYVHKAGDSEGDSLLVEIVKDFKGKVVLIDFWNTWCGPCRQALKEMAPMEESYEGKDVVFVFVADTSSPENEYNGMIPSMKGHHFRFTESQASSLKSKWGFNGIPSYVIIGKDGIVKDYHTGFYGNEYYKQKIDEELNK